MILHCTQKLATKLPAVSATPLTVAQKLNERPDSVRGRWLFPDREMKPRIEQLGGRSA